jgi:signal transduction histidine kinase
VADTEERALFRGPHADVLDAMGQPVGFLYVLPPPPDGEIVAPPTRTGFLESVNRWLLAAVAGAGLLALLATAAVGRRILGPVAQLTGAARRMAGGDLAHRAEVTSRDEVGTLARAFNQMAASLERQERLRRQMVTDVAHDLRTPLTNIRGQLEALQDGLLDASPEVLASLHEEVMFLSRLVVDLQDLSLAEAGKLRLEVAPFQVSTEVQQVLQALVPPPSNGAVPGPMVETDLPELPDALADPARFRQVVLNLLSNAWTHTPEDGRILVQAREAGGEIEVSVRDTGPGIGPEHLPHIFERFYRGDPSRARRTGGAGLGLAIVKHLVTVQNGRVWARSRPGEGASFFFTLPIAPGPAS